MGRKDRRSCVWVWLTVTSTCIQFAYPSLWVVSRPSVDKNGEEGTISAGDYQKGDSAVRLCANDMIRLGYRSCDSFCVQLCLWRWFGLARNRPPCSVHIHTVHGFFTSGLQAFFVGEADGDIEAKLGDVVQRGASDDKMKWMQGVWYCCWG